MVIYNFIQFFVHLSLENILFIQLVAVCIIIRLCVFLITELRFLHNCFNTYTNIYYWLFSATKWHFVIKQNKIFYEARFTAAFFNHNCSLIANYFQVFWITSLNGKVAARNTFLMQYPDSILLISICKKKRLSTFINAFFSILFKKQTHFIKYH